MRRLFVNDLTGRLYILDRSTKAFTTYLDFDGRGTRTGLFDKLAVEEGLASGFISFEFDPDYASNGRFYTIHLEDLEMPGARTPDNAGVPGLDVAGYAPTPAVRTPGDVDHEAVLIEWTDTNVADAVFKGTARELMRVALNSRIHPMGDLTFNPTAHRGDPDWRVLYVACGDGGAGEQKTAIRCTRSGSIRSSARFCGSCPTSRRMSIRARSARTDAIAFLATTPSSRATVRARRSGRTVCGTRTA